MDLLDLMVYGMVFGWIGAMLLAGLFGWIWNRTRGCVRDFWHDWREFRRYRRSSANAPRSERRQGNVKANKERPPKRQL